MRPHTDKQHMTRTLEVEVRKRSRRNMVRNALLSTIAFVPMLTVAMAAPKVLSLIKDEHVDYILPRNPKRRLQENISRLKKKGLVTFEKNGEKCYLRLTQAGRKELERVTQKETPIQKPRRWDRRWRIVIFDIPEARKSQRNRIRTLVRNLGFYCLQQSVWVYPYDCEEVIALLKTDLKIGTQLLYVIADAIEYDRPLRQHFKLPLSD